MKMFQIPKERYDEVMGHLDSSQGSDLKSLLMDALKKKESSESPMKESKESPGMEAMEDNMGTEMHGDQLGKPKGLSVEKISVMKKPGDMGDMMSKKGNGMGVHMDNVADNLTKPDDMGANEGDMTDDELKELIGKYLS